MKTTALLALDMSQTAGAAYADVRIVHSRERHLATKNGTVSQILATESLGIGIRVIAAGCWGFAATDDLTHDGLERAARLAVAIAKSGTLASKAPVRLAGEQPYTATWESPCQEDPFAVPVDEQIALLLQVDGILTKTPGITLAESSLAFARTRQIFASSIGSVIDQTRTVSGGGFTAHSFQHDEIQKRSYPNSFGGQYQQRGYELIRELDLPAHAPRVAEEAVALHSADQCPHGEYTLIVDSSQLGLQIHESIGHPIELDRVLGSEANYAGMSFLNLGDLDQLQYGSSQVNVVCNATADHGPGLGTFAFDDEGVPAQATPIIVSGLFTGFMTSRETAATIGAGRSNGTMRADGWEHIPLIRMTNVSLLPLHGSFDQICDVSHAIYMETNKSWSIDDKRYNFQFGCEIAWEMRNGKRIRMLKNPSYSGISTEFWNSCEDIAGPDDWVLWGVPNCGKGQPEQVMGTGHGASPARFRNIKVGGAYAG